MRPASLLPALVLLLAAGAGADVVHLKSGNRIEGAARVDGTLVHVETMSAQLTMPYAEVERIDRDHEAAIERYFDRLAEVEREPSAAGYLDLAAWAAAEGGKRLVAPNVEAAAAILRRVEDPAEVRRVAFAYAGRLDDAIEPIWRHLMLLEPEDEHARRALGFRRLEGEWVTEAEFQVAQGNVEFEGRWVARGERDRIVEERAQDLRVRVRAVADRERDVGRREQDASRREEGLRRTEDRLDRLTRELLALRRDLDERERDIARRERLLDGLLYCRTCGVWYRGAHICGSSWFYCRRCDGWFRPGHRCLR